MAVLHDNEVRLRDSAQGPTEHEIDTLIPDLTDVDIHEHIPELREAIPQRAATRVRWLSWFAGLLVVLAIGIVAAVLIVRGGDTRQQHPDLADGPWTNSLTVPVLGPKPYDAPGWHNVDIPVTGTPAVLVAEFAVLEAAVTPATVVRDLPGTNRLIVPAIPTNVLEFAALEDAVVPASGPLTSGVTAEEFAALEDAVTPRAGGPNRIDGPGTNSLNLNDG